ncbi:MAG: hypothetical protein QOE70_4369 [Chthoniobacter sp.]|jgi:hypothetical protein|nr:hypothetical protein [Chthoniobacter sp.]
MATKPTAKRTTTKATPKTMPAKAVAKKRKT